MNRIKQFEPLLGKWYFENFIGAGSFGRVYKAYCTDGETKQYAAIKFLSIPADEAEIDALKDEGLDQQSIMNYYSTVAQEFTNEARLMNQMKECVNIVSCEDSCAIPKTDGIGFNVFIVMELLESLPDRLRKKPLDKQETVKLGLDICTALDYCAKQGIVHRDIKPDNIFIDVDGNFKLGDFGIARRLEKTMAFMSKKGTYNYMAPEVYRGDLYGANCDVYSLGIVLYRMMNKNRLPFLPPAPASIMPDDQERAMVRRMKGEKLPPPCEADPAFSRIILKACAFNPAYRYQTAKDMWRELFNLNYAYNRASAGTPAEQPAAIPQDRNNNNNDTGMTGQIEQTPRAAPFAGRPAAKYGAAASAGLAGLGATVNPAPNGGAGSYVSVNPVPNGGTGSYVSANPVPKGGAVNPGSNNGTSNHGAAGQRAAAPAEAAKTAAEKPKKADRAKPKKTESSGGKGGSKQVGRIVGIVAAIVACVGIFAALWAAGLFSKNSTDTQTVLNTEPAEATAAPTEEPTEEPTAQPTEEPVGEEPEYTYRTSMVTGPVNWSPFAWESSDESRLMSYIEAPLIDISMADDGVNFTWVYEMATGLTDVTATYPNRTKWLVPDSSGNLPTTNMIYRIDLNPDAKWANGKPITAADYIYSMQQMLDPNNKNYRASSYSSDDAEIRNARAYMNNDLAGQPIYEQADTSVTADTFYVDLSRDNVFFGESYTPRGLYDDGYANYFTDAEGESVFDKWANAEGWITVTDEIRQDLMQMSANFGYTDDDIWKDWCYYISGTYQTVPWSDVGLVAEGDYTLYYILENPISEFYMKNALTKNWLVYRDLYEAGRTEKDGRPANTYGTSPETYMATGPYKLESFEAGKQYVLVRNENWFGWTDGKHEGQYKTTRIICSIIPNHVTALMSFEKGEIDEVEILNDDYVLYKQSPYLLKTDETYTGRFVFATDIEKLRELEDEVGDGSNKKVLSYRDFRKAISLSINRKQFCTDCTYGYKPAFFLINSLYYYDVEHNINSQYRNTMEGHEAILRLYGVTGYTNDVTAYNAITGYNVTAAKTLFQSVYERAVADGNYTNGQLIHIRCEVSAADLTEMDILQQNRLTEYVAAAAKGTGFEGKISFEFIGNADQRYKDVAAGKIEMIRGAWGGAAFYPFNLIRVYCDPDYLGGLDRIHESCGWDPTMETLTINIGGTDITKTLNNWAKAISDGGEYAGDAYVETKLKILSYLETAILSSYQCIPYGTRTECSLISKKVKYPTEEYNLMYGFGGLRLLTYNYCDADWDAYVASQGGRIDYK